MACTSVLQTMNSIPLIPAWIIRLTALPPPPPTPITLIFAVSCSSSRVTLRLPSRSDSSNVIITVSPDFISLFFNMMSICCEPRPHRIGHSGQTGSRAPPHSRFLILESPQQQPRGRGPLRSVNRVGESAQSARHALARALIKDLLDHLHHSVHLRAAADDDHAGADLLVETDLLDVAIDEFCDLRRARFENAGQLVFGKDLRRAAAHRRHFDRIVFR